MRAITVLVALAAVLGACGGDETSARSASPALTQPDIVVIMTDDQTLESLRVMDNTLHLIGDAGVTFDQAVASHPVCCPSRATFLTGQLSHNHGVRGNAPPLGGYALFDDRNTLPVWMHAAGYHTAFVGKYLNGYDEQAPARIPPGWDDWRALLDPGTYRAYDYSVLDNGERHHYGLGKADYQTDVTTDLAVAQIEASPADKPLLLSVNYRAPHSEDGETLVPGASPLAYPTPAVRHEGTFQDVALPRSFAANENLAQREAKPPVVRAAISAATSLFGLFVTYQDQYQRELESLLAVDEGIARILDSLSRRRSLAESLIIYTSDNGLFHGEHGLTTKYFGYDPALRVPLVIRGRGFPAGEHYAYAASNVDLAPTILNAGKASAVGIELDGRSLDELVANPAPDRAVAIEGRPMDDVADAQPGWFGARSAQWKYVRWADNSEELYDLSHDPDELENLAVVATRASQVAAWRELATRLSTCAGESCEAVEPVVGVATQ